MKVEKRKISSLKGIGEKTEKLFQKIGVDTVEDLIRYYPKGFEIFEDPISVGEVEEGKVCTVPVTSFKCNVVICILEFVDT